MAKLRAKEGRRTEPSWLRLKAEMEVAEEKLCKIPSHKQAAAEICVTLEEACNLEGSNNVIQ
jgi:hypothetical protein